MSGKSLVIIPTKEIVRTLRESLAMAPEAEYEVNDLLSGCVRVLERNDTRELDIWAEELYDKFCLAGFDRDSARIITAAVLEFGRRLFLVYCQTDLYNERGVADYYFYGLKGGDMVLARQDMDYDDNRHSREAVYQAIVKRAVNNDRTRNF